MSVKWKKSFHIHKYMSYPGTSQVVTLQSNKLNWMELTSIINKNHQALIRSHIRLETSLELLFLESKVTSVTFVVWIDSSLVDWISDRSCKGLSDEHSESFWWIPASVSVTFLWLSTILCMGFTPLSQTTLMTESTEVTVPTTGGASVCWPELSSSSSKTLYTSLQAAN